MGKFTGVKTPPKLRTPMQTTGPTLTHEGGAGFSRDPKSDLFLFAVVNMVSEDTFYEGATDRDARFRDLIWQCVRTDPGWVARFVPFLRNEMNMRSASVVMAAEYGLALRNNQAPDARGLDPSAPSVRTVVASALSRADEPSEFVAYWVARTGKRTLPSGAQRGLSDAVNRLYKERAVIKYDGTGQPWRLGDVVELVHPKPSTDWQGDLYGYLLDRRHHKDELRVSLDRLPMIAAARAFLALSPVEQRTTALSNPDVLSQAGLTWEVLSSSGAMDQAAWEAIIPRMGYMALLRNLRNFDQAGVSDGVAAQVIAKLTDPDEVAKSRQFPYRFLSAYKAVSSLRWSQALETALGLSAANVPALPGRTLILIDTSASMTNPVSRKSTVRHVDIAALFGFVTALRNDADVYGYAGADWGPGKKVVFEHKPSKGGAVLREMDAFTARIGEVDHGTMTAQAIRQTYRPEHSRIMIFTDGQAFDSYAGPVTTAAPAHVPMFGVDTSGYGPSMLDLSKPNRYAIGGFSDKLFTMVSMLSSGKSTDWPF